MLKTLSIVLLCLLLLSPLSLAAQEPNLLWNIPFDTRLHKVIPLLEDRGIKTHITDVKLPLVGRKSALESTNDGEFNLYGYPYHLICIGSKPLEFTLSFSINGSLTDKTLAAHTITSGLQDKYGFPDYCSVETYSNGFRSWTIKDKSGQHELAVIDPADAIDFSPDDYLSSWPYSTPDTELTLIIHFYNIKFKAEYNKPMGSDDLLIEVSFTKHSHTTKKAKFEEYIAPDLQPTSPPDSF